MNKNISKTITALRFPICVMVVFIHSTLRVNLSGVAVTTSGGHLIHDYISYGLCASAVPLFLLISGYLYFKGCEVQYKWEDYLEKNKKRFRTLVIPYLIWNIFTLLLFLSAQSLMPNMISGKHTHIMEYSLFDWIMVFWDAGEGFPINGPMWFIRDLIVLSVLSLLIYPLIKNKWIGLAFVIVSFLLGVKDIFFILT